jgi:hypothetical protein
MISSAKTSNVAGFKYHRIISIESCIPARRIAARDILDRSRLKLRFKVSAAIKIIISRGSNQP